MYFKLCVSVFLFYISTVFGKQYLVVSTTQQPPAPLYPFEQQLLTTNKQQLHLIDKYNEKFLQTLEIINNRYENSINETKHLKKILDKMEKKLEETEKKLKIMSKKYDDNLQKAKNEIIFEVGKSRENNCQICDNTTIISKDIKTEIEKKERFRNCKEVQMSGKNTSGMYVIEPESSFKAFNVWCDMVTEEGGWTYVLNRFDGSQNFYLNWTDYKYGFGVLSREHWLGLEQLHHLTNSRRNELLIQLSDWDDNIAYALYDNFKVGRENQGYKLLSLGKYSGTAGDSFGWHLGMKFSTPDHDQDEAEWNCALFYRGGWWYKTCHMNQLTGLYLKKYDLAKQENDWQALGIHWKEFKGLDYSLKKVKMMVRPKGT